MSTTASGLTPELLETVFALSDGQKALLLDLLDELDAADKPAEPVIRHASLPPEQ